MRRTSQFAAALAIALVGCGPSGTDAPAPSARPGVGAAPVARPASVAATFVMDDVARLHDDLKARYGLGAYLLGKSWAGTAVSFVGLPIATAEHVDLDGSIRGAFTAGATDLGFAIAIPLKNPGALLAVVTAGDAAPFRRRPEGTWDHLVPAHEAPGAPARALAGNFLIVASSPAVLSELGPFVAQPGAGDFQRVGLDARAGAPASSIRGVVHVEAAKPWLAWTSARVGAAAPFDPAALSPARFGDEIPVHVSFGATAVVAALDLGPPLDGAARPLEPGPLARLLELPADTDAALLLFQPEHAREASARAGSKWLETGPLANAGPSLAPAFGEIARARGPGLAVGFQRTGTGPMMFGLADLGDRSRAEKGLEALVKALDAKEVATALASRGLGLSASSTVLERIGDVTRIRVSRGEETAASIVLRIQGENLAFASGADAPSGLVSLLGRATPLASVPALAALAGDAGSTVLAAGLVDASRIRNVAGREAGPRAFVLATLVEADGVVRLRVAAEPPALASLL